MLKKLANLEPRIRNAKLVVLGFIYNKLKCSTILFEFALALGVCIIESCEKN